MTIKIEGAGFENKGAALMLLSIISKLRAHFGPKTRIVVDEEIGTRVQKAELNLFEEAHFQRFKVPHLIPTSQLTKYNLVNPKDIDLILNASGFSLSDQWVPYSDHYFSQRLKRYRFYKKNGTKIIYLPQAFGPFNSNELRAYMYELEKLIDIFFVRDNISYNHLSTIFPSNENIFKYPDFTNLFDVKDYSDYSNCFIIIPNHKMITKGRLKKDQYLKFLVEVAKMVHSSGLKIVLLNHEGVKDSDLINEINEFIKDYNPELLIDLSPDHVKAIIKGARGVMTSRYHGAVSSFSQIVPTIITSWSHKYEELADDYRSKDYIVECDMENSHTESKIKEILDPDSNRNIRTALKASSKEQKKLSIKMWEHVFNYFDSSGKWRH